MMELKAIKNELWEIAKVYPTLRGLLQSELRGGGCTVGEHWAMVIRETHLDAEHFANVCWEYATCKRALPSPADRLLQELISESSERTWRDRERLAQYEKYHNQENWRDINRDAVWCRIIKYVMRNPQPPDRIEDLIRWEKGGPRPEWLEQPATK